MADTKEFIAETDETGQVICVWMTDPETRLPRPFNPHTDRFVPEAPAAFSGANPHAIAAWIAQAALQGRGAVTR